jgi:hypothetical protein
MHESDIQPALGKFIDWLHDEYPNLCIAPKASISPSEQWLKASADMAVAIKLQCGCESVDADPPPVDPSSDCCKCEPVPPWEKYATITELQPGDLEKARELYPDIEDPCVVRTCCECGGSSSGSSGSSGSSEESSKEESSKEESSKEESSKEESSGTSTSGTPACDCCDIKCMTLDAYFHGDDGGVAGGDICPECDGATIGVPVDSLLCRMSNMGNICTYSGSSGTFDLFNNCEGVTSPQDVTVELECQEDGRYSLKLTDPHAGVWILENIDPGSIYGTHSLPNTVAAILLPCSPYVGNVIITIAADQSGCAAACIAKGIDVGDSCFEEGGGVPLIARIFDSIDARTGQPIGGLNV